MRTKAVDTEHDSHHAANRGSNHCRNRAASAKSDVRRALQELDDSAGDLREAVRLDDGSVHGHIALAAARREAAERLEAVLRQIAPAISEAEYHEAGIQQDFYSTWLEWLTFDCHQGAGTLMEHLARTRRLLLRAIGAEDPVHRSWEGHRPPFGIGGSRPIGPWPCWLVGHAKANHGQS